MCLYFDLNKRVRTCQRKCVKWNRGWLAQVEGVRKSATVRRSRAPWRIPSNTRGSVLAWPVWAAMGCSWGRGCSGDLSHPCKAFPRQESSSVPFPLAEDTRGGTAESCCKLGSRGAARGPEPSRATWLRVLWQLVFWPVVFHHQPRGHNGTGTARPPSPCFAFQVRPSALAKVFQERTWSRRAGI